ncbi:MAG: ABC transporter substrate-binding protein [Clostridiales bacterium]|nr:ABC transporter substrate-binding protein [Clostridiales bacterium]
MKKKLLSLLLALSFVVSLTACGSSDTTGGTSDSASSDAVSDTSEGASSTAEEAEASAAEEGSDSGEFAGTITLGMIGPMTGSLAVYGTHVANGVNLAIEQINAAGGVIVGDETYELAVESKDDQGDSTECLNAMNALISDGIELVIGSATSGCTSSITSVANSEGVVLITPSGTADALTTEMDYVFRTCFKDSFQGELAAQYAADEGYTKVGIVYCSADTYSAGLRDAFAAAAEELGLEVVAEESVATMTEVDYTNQFTKMVEAGAELVFIPFYYDVTGPYLVPQARSVGFDGILLGADGVDNTETTIPDGADLSVYNDFLFVNHYSTELATSDISTSFVESYEEAYGETPNNFDALGYDAVLVLKQAIESCGAFDADSVQAALADTSVVYEVSTGTFSFDDTGTPIKTGVLMGYSYTEGDDAVTKIAVTTLSLD